MRLYELFGDPPGFGPTKSFVRVHGQYCGPGNAGGEPIDDVDSACRAHDICYFENGRFNPDCDGKFVDTLTKLLDKKLTIKQQLAVRTMRAFFKRKLRKT